MKFYADDWLTIYQGDVRAVLPELPSDSVDCIVTSPPYWGLRDYGSEGQLGLERTPEEYVANMVAVFRELRRVLKPSGTCWLNLGDSYAAGGKGGGGSFMAERGDAAWHHRSAVNGWRPPPKGLKPKDLVGIPWRVAFALQADGWYLRSDIIWAKPNPMPESVTDRPTKAHEYLFLLTKAARYYYDADAVREAAVRYEGFYGSGGGMDAGTNGQRNDGGREQQLSGMTGRNLRSVWTIATRPYPGAHFAVFPPELPERCIKAGSSERGVCPDCGAPWERVTDGASYYKGDNGSRSRKTNMVGNGHGGGGRGPKNNLGSSIARTTGWEPACKHPTDPYTRGFSNPPVPAVVLDPFAGSGTTGMVANRLSRRAILIDLNGDYLKQQLARNAQTPLGLAG